MTEHLTMQGTGAGTRIPTDPAQAGGNIPCDPTQAGLGPGGMISPDPQTAEAQAASVEVIPK